MRLLILTQSVDRKDPVLGFFHQWIEKLAEDHEHTDVVCLREGDHQLPQNIHVYSLGKERGRSRIKYIYNFYRYIFSLQYDAVFVHMNEEYVLLGGLFWKCVGKRVYLWRNYHRGSLLTACAVMLSTLVFCTSKHSYTAKFKKTVLMPVGIDTERFFPEQKIQQLPHSILFLSGMWPSKRPELLVEALSVLQKKGIEFTANFYGTPLPSTRAYYESVQDKAREAGLSSVVTFHPGVPNSATPDLYRSHQIFVNCSPSGMFDKTLFEAAACGAYVLSSSKDFAEVAGSETYFDSVSSLAACLEEAISAKPPRVSRAPVAQNSLTALMECLHKTL